RDVYLVYYPSHRPPRLAHINRCYYPVRCSNWPKASALWRCCRNDCLEYRDRPVSRHCATQSGAGLSSFLATSHPRSHFFHRYLKFVDAKSHHAATVEAARITKIRAFLGG